MIDLSLKQSWLETSSETAFEEYKSALVDNLNAQRSDRHVQERWEITKVSEGDTAHLYCDELPVLTFVISSGQLHIKSEGDVVARYDDMMLLIRFTARQLGFSVYSNVHSGSLLPRDPFLTIDHGYFNRNDLYKKFFGKSNFIPRFCVVKYEADKITVNPPYFLENKDDGSIHIVNTAMLDFLVQKEDQSISDEFSYKIAESMDEFAKKDDLALTPATFYSNYKKSVKVINQTAFDIETINRKVFIDPYIWDFDAEHSPRFYDNVKNGLHMMDKIRRGETLDVAVKRMLIEEFKLSGEYVGIRIWDVEFDRDKEGVLTPRLKMHIFVHGLDSKRRSDDHDWVSRK
jgi:hypothetical protein